MNLLKLATTTILISGFASVASAQDTGFYVNLGADVFSLDIEDADTVSPITIGGKVGYNVNQYFAVEGQAAFGLSDSKLDNEDGTDSGVDAGIDSSFAAFGVVKYPVSDQIEIFGRAGYHFTEVGLSADELDGVNVGVDTDGFALGLGGQYMFDGSNGIRLEYTYLDADFDGDDLDLDEDVSGNANVFSLSYVRKF